VDLPVALSLGGRDELAVGVLDNEISGSFLLVKTREQESASLRQQPPRRLA
jgi:hypothetical protein